MNKVFEKAYAKINLGLKVGIQRDDGFHDIETIMACINLYDDIYIEESEETIIEGMDIPYQENLMFKAIQLIKKTYRINKHVKVVINKKIPIGAGLGGGSSNAAAVLRGLNRLWQLELSGKTMEILGQEIGSDVSFFVRSKTSIVKGKGEVINPLDIKLPYKVLLVLVPYNISTKEIYENYTCVNKANFAYSDTCFLPKDLKNDLEAVYEKLYPNLNLLISNLKEDLRGDFNLMSGSGPTVFSLYEKNKDLIEIITNIKNRYQLATIETVFLDNL